MFDTSKEIKIENAMPVKFSQKDFKDNIFLLDNTPEVPEQGLKVNMVSVFLLYLILNYQKKKKKIGNIV